jgi:hypothetical protein
LRLLALQGCTHPAPIHSIGIEHGMWNRSEFRVRRDLEKRLQEPLLEGTGPAPPNAASPLS